MNMLGINKTTSYSLDCLFPILTQHIGVAKAPMCNGRRNSSDNHLFSHYPLPHFLRQQARSPEAGTDNLRLSLLGRGVCYEDALCRLTTTQIPLLSPLLRGLR